MEEKTQRILELFPVLNDLPESARATILDGGILETYQPGTLLSKNANTCPFVPLVVCGGLRIFISSPEGREVTIYHAHPGDCCLMGIACRMRVGLLPAEVEVDQESELFTIPAAIYERHLEPNALWNRFLFASLYEGMYNAIQTFEHLMFSRVDERLAKYLMNRTKGRTTTLYITHEQLAVNLNTVREVVSRLMSELKRRGILSYERGKVRIIDIQALKELGRR